MNASPADQLSTYELAQLLHFYAESGVEWALEDEPVDRFLEYAELEARRAARLSQPERAQEARAERRPDAGRQASPPPRQQPMAIPDGEAVAEAQRLAAAARTLEELADGVAAFTGCNLRNSARNTAFMSGNHAAKILVVGGAPSADDDRDGAPFSGPAGGMLARMLAGIAIALDEVLIANLVPWRPPGNRPPTPHETEICRPFDIRLIEILKPRAVLALGSHPAKVLSGSTEGIHSLRGKRIDLDIAGQMVPMIATFHPLEIMQTPLNKRFAWQDLLAFNALLTA